MMNVYDFDDTIYNGDSSVDFVLYCFKRNKKLFKYIPTIIWSFILYFFKRIDKTTMKEHFFSFLSDIDASDYVDDFWKSHKKNIKKFYLDNQKSNDVIISASPVFLLKPICDDLGIKNLIATEVDPKTGKFLSENCKGSRKVELFYEKFPKKKIREFYSDSLSDSPLADISREAYIVDNDIIREWPIKKNKSKKNYFVNFFLLISGISFLIFNMFDIEYDKYFVLCILLDIFIYFIIYIFIGKKDFIGSFNERSKFNKIISLIGTYGLLFFVGSLYCGNLSLIINNMAIFSFVSHYKLFVGVTSVILFLFSIPFCTLVLSYLYNIIFSTIFKAFKELKTSEKAFISFIIILLCILALISFIKAPQLYSIDNDNYRYDVVYTSDTLSLLKHNTWMNIFFYENDIRQPLFALYSIPFFAPIYAIFALISLLGVNLIPFGIEFVQIILLVLSISMFSLVISKDSKKRILFMLLFSSLYSTLLFSVMIEQYVVAVFFISLLLYAYINKLKTKDYYIGSVGTLSTSCMLFPLLFNSNDRFYHKIRKVLKACFYGVFVFLALGRVDIFYNFFNKVGNLVKFTGEKIGLLDRFNQYTHFIQHIFIAPKAGIVIDNWRLDNITTISIIGIVIFILCIISYFINRKDKLSKISMYWIIFSFIMLFLIGWGTAENGLILYSLYFGWAFLILLYKLFDKIFTKFKLNKLFTLIMIIIIITLCIYNTYNIIDMVNQFNALL